MNKILKSTRFVIENSSHVTIDEKNIEPFVKEFDRQQIQHWLTHSPFDIRQLDAKERLMFLLIFNAISFSYWGNPKWTVEYKGNKEYGAYGMISCLAKSFENNPKILDAKYLAGISRNEFAKILHGNVEIPLFEERLKIIREVGSVLVKKFHGDFSNLVQAADKDAIKLLKLLLINFPSFEDYSLYKRENIWFCKRTQLLISDIYQAFNGKGIGEIKNIGELTACADYKLPFVLRKLGILNYSNKLAEKIDNKMQLDKDSEEEVEIRANTIWAVEKIKQKLKSRFPDIDSIYINDRLWLMGQEKSSNDKPYHLTRTTAY